MYKLVDTYKAAGKTVEKVNQLREFTAILFTDNTAFVTRAYEDREGSEVSVEVITEDSSPYDCGEWDKHYLGILTKDEAESRVNELNMKAKEDRQLKEREEYERLHKKFNKTEATG